MRQKSVGNEKSYMDLVCYLQYKIWRTMERDPLFAHSPVELTMDEQRKLATERTLRLLEYDFLPTGSLMDDPRMVLTHS